MRWDSEHVDNRVRAVLLDSSWVDSDNARGRRLAENIEAFSGDVDDLLERVRSHGIMPLFSRTVREMHDYGGHEALSKHLPMERIKAEGEQAREWIDLYYRELARIGEVSAHHRIHPIVLKGPAWEPSLYQNTRTRSFKDLDLYVDTEQLEQFGSVLKNLGYRQAVYDAGRHELVDVPEARNRAALESGRHATPYLKPSPVAGQYFRVEPHGPLNDHNFHKTDTSSFFSHSRPLALGGVRSLQLSVVDSLIYACAHIRKNLYVHSPAGQSAIPKLRWFCDIRQMFLTFPDPGAWHRLFERAAELRQTDAVYQALIYTDRLFEGVVPAGLLDSPAGLSGSPDQVIDNVWQYRYGSSTFDQRLFEPHLDESRYLRLRDAGKAGGRLVIPRVEEPPRKDDVLAAWPWEAAEPQRLSGLSAPDWQYFRSHVSFGEVPRSDAEFSASFAVLATAKDLAIKVSVRDERLCFDQKSGYYHGQDCVQLLFEHPYLSRAVCNVLLVPKAADLDRPTALFHFSGSERARTEDVRGAQVEARITNSGYVLAATVPFSALGMAAETTTFGFDVCVYESGAPGEERRTVLQWSGGRNNVRNPSYFGIATLEAGT
ncbi:nucleotidyltransferase family protein [Nonomuraea sp. NPDC046802]|uniref:nucleotidyltransferase family protein n=1 Tax=Nonomuraea sp. NPDC046802 TaxID=3154919 RepID=UPI0033FF4708